MKKEYEAPKAEIVQFNYTETVLASKGNAYQLYVDKYYACNDSATNKWYNGNFDESCRIE
ncbi:MAG: hypothetical protein IKQ45_08365 [Clostridia bacterium]|nr:hypothetical protein [Clostridia bacterium]